MAVQWYCNISGKTFGPISAHQLKALAENGKLSPQHKVRQGEKGSWVPAERVKGLFTQEIPQAKAVPVPPEPDRIGIAASGSIPIAPVVGRSGHGQTSGKRRRKNNSTVVVALVLLIAGLTVVAIALLVANSDSEKKPADRAETAKATQVKKKDVDELRESEKIEDLTDADSESEQSTPIDDKDDKPKSQSVDSKWTDASSSSAKRGDVRVKILSAKTGFPKLSKKIKNPKKYLILNVELYNGNSRRKLEYSSWGSRAATNRGLKLTDDAGNTYRSKTFRRVAVEGQLTTEPVYPRESIQDVLVFERPVDGIEHLLLTLPSAAFGDLGVLYFKITKEMIAEGDQAEITDDEETDEATKQDNGDDGHESDIAAAAEDPAPGRKQDNVEEDPRNEFRRNNPELFSDDDENDGDNSLEGKLKGFK